MRALFYASDGTTCEQRLFLQTQGDTTVACKT